TVDAACAPTPPQRLRRRLRPRRRDRDRRDPRDPDRRARDVDRRCDLAGAAAPLGRRLAGPPARLRRLRRTRCGRRGHRDTARVPRRRRRSLRRGGDVTAAIDVRDLFRVHQTPEGDAAALQGLSLTVREREIVTVLGPSGSGKSTFLRILAGLDRPSAGTVRVFGIEIGKLPTADVARYRTRTVGYAD